MSGIQLSECTSIHELKALLILARSYPSKKIVSSLLSGESAEDVLRSQAINSQDDARYAEQELDKCKNLDVKLITLACPTYPKLLREIADPPILLYMLGNFVPSDEHSISVVGSRYPSHYGLTQTRKFSGYLAEQGLTIVSGLAKGIDQAAHTSALAIPYGRTIAVMGCGLDQDYPRGSQSLKQRILKRGAIISEYPFGTPPRAENFPKRNRIISGLSLGTLVVQAHQRSGSLITAHAANEQGREVFSVPGPVDDYVSKGTHRLIREGALLVEHPEEIFEEMAPVIRGSIANDQSPDVESDLQIKVEEFSHPEEKIIDCLTHRPTSFEELAENLSEPTSQLASSLLQLELKRVIQKQPDGRYQLVQGSGGS